MNGEVLEMKRARHVWGFILLPGSWQSFVSLRGGQESYRRHHAPDTNLTSRSAEGRETSSTPEIGDRVRTATELDGGGRETETTMIGGNLIAWDASTRRELNRGSLGRTRQMMGGGVGQASHSFQL